MARELAAATVAMIKGAIERRGCLSGSHAAFRVRFAPHVLGCDENGTYIVVGFEYGGLTVGGTHWVRFLVDRLRALEPNGDPWRTASLESRPQFDLTQIIAAVDGSWSRKPSRT
jgi:hypothetical protein